MRPMPIVYAAVPGQVSELPRLFISLQRETVHV
jgi:hypothetical protein